MYCMGALAPTVLESVGTSTPIRVSESVGAILIKFCLLSCLLSIVHFLILSPHTSPAILGQISELDFTALNESSIFMKKILVKNFNNFLSSITNLNL